MDVLREVLGQQDGQLIANKSTFDTTITLTDMAEFISAITGVSSEDRAARKKSPSQPKKRTKHDAVESRVGEIVNTAKKLTFMDSFVADSNKKLRKDDLSILPNIEEVISRTQEQLQNVKSIPNDPVLLPECTQFNK